MAHTAHDIDELAHALYNLSALRRELQRFAGGEHAVAGLMVLSAVERIGPARISDVAADVQVNPSVASRQIQALQDEGFVDRVADPHDGRSSLVAITDDGTAKLAGAHRRLLDALGSAVEDWDHDEVAGLATGIVRLREAFGGCESRPSAGAAGVPGAAGAASDAARRDPRAVVDTASADTASADTRSADTAPVDARPTTTHLPADRPAADPTVTSAQIADARHEEHTR